MPRNTPSQAQPSCELLAVKINRIIWNCVWNDNDCWHETENYILLFRSSWRDRAIRRGVKLRKTQNFFNWKITKDEQLAYDCAWQEGQTAELISQLSDISMHLKRNNLSFFIGSLKLNIDTFHFVLSLHFLDIEINLLEWSEHEARRWDFQWNSCFWSIDFEFISHENLC